MKYVLLDIQSKVRNLHERDLTALKAFFGVTTQQELAVVLYHLYNVDRTFTASMPMDPNTIILLKEKLNSDGKGWTIDPVEEVFGMIPEKYLDWAVNSYLEGGTTIHEIPETFEYLSLFDLLKVHGKLDPNKKIGKFKFNEADINSYCGVNGCTLKFPRPGLRDWIETHHRNDITGIEEEQKKAKQIKEEAEKVFETENVVVIHPKTQEASCKYGAGTKWCTAARKKNKFSVYNEQGPLYIVIDKKMNKKYQLHFEMKQFMDEKDIPIDLNVLCCFVPDLREWFNQIGFFVPKWDWDWGLLSSNSNITMKDVLTNYNKPWKWNRLSRNPSIAMKDVLANPTELWDWYNLSQNPSITMKDVLANPDKEWDWRILSQKPSIKIEDVLANPDKEWDWDWVSLKPGIKMDYVFANSNKPWNWIELSRNPSIKIEDVLANPDEVWEWPKLSVNPNITMEFVLANPKKPWDWSELSRNPSIKIKDVIANPKKPWDWDWMSQNPNITMEFVLANPDKPWDWYALSVNPGIKIEDVIANPDKPWNTRGLSRNPSITMKDIITHSMNEIKWDWVNVTWNSSITMKDIIDCLPWLEEHEKGLQLDWENVWLGFSSNPNITMKDMITHLDMPWVWDKLPSKSDFKPEYTNMDICEVIGMFRHTTTVA